MSSWDCFCFLLVDVVKVEVLVALLLLLFLLLLPPADDDCLGCAESKELSGLVQQWM